MPVRDELLTRYKSTMLELLKLPGMGPKTVALIFEATGVATVDDLAVAIDEGRLADLPRVGDKLIQKLRKGIDEYRKNSGRFHLDDAEIAAERLTLYLKDFPGIESVTPAGSLAAAATPSAISTCSSPARPAKRTPSPPLSSTPPPIPPSRSSCARPEQSQLPAAHRTADRCASPPTRLLRRGAAIFHWLQDA